jgi:hypothetical protein
VRNGPRLTESQAIAHPMAASHHPTPPFVPPRQVSAALTVLLLAVGVAVGAAIGPAPKASLAASAQARLLASTLIPLAERARARAAESATATSVSSATPPPISTITKTPSPAGNAVKSTRSSPTAKAPATNRPSPTSTPPSATGKAPASSSPAPPATPAPLPAITHVWLIVLSGQSFTQALAKSSEDPYLTKSLLPKGTLLSDYAANAGSPLANDIGLISGQASNPETQQNCPTYSPVQPPTVNPKSGLTEGVGCVYPQAAQTLADQLTTAGLTWRAYLEGMAGNGSAAPATPTAGAPTPATTPANTATPPGTDTEPSAAQTTTCRHPALGTPDPAHTATPGQPYLAFRNPFVYFDSLLESGSCTSDDVDLSQLGSDLGASAGPANLSWIAPSACDDGSTTPCSPGAPAGLKAADAFLRQTIPAITKTSAYADHGLIVITSDAAGADSPSTSGTGSTTTEPVGVLLLSPFVRTNARVSGTYNQFSLLKSLERLFGVPLLGHAADPSVTALGAEVYRATKKAASAASQPRHPVASKANR